eukprot:610767_1
MSNNPKAIDEVPFNVNHSHEPFDSFRTYYSFCDTTDSNDRNCNVLPDLTLEISLQNELIHALEEHVSMLRDMIQHLQALVHYKSQNDSQALEPWQRDLYYDQLLRYTEQEDAITGLKRENAFLKSALHQNDVTAIHDLQPRCPHFIRTDCGSELSTDCDTWTVDSGLELQSDWESETDVYMIIQDIDAISES